MKQFVSFWGGLLVLLCAQATSAQSSRTLTGRLIPWDINAKNVEYVLVVVRNENAAVTKDQGLFTMALRNDVTSITIELPNSKFRVLYPEGGKAEIPKGKDDIKLDVIVGYDSGDLSLKAAIKERTEMKQHIGNISNGISKINSKQDTTYTMVKTVAASVEELKNLQIERNQNTIEKDKQKAAFYPILSKALNNYVNEAKNARDMFRFIANYALEDTTALLVILEKIKVYDAAYEEINNRHSSDVQTVFFSWDEAKAVELKEFFNYALGVVHNECIQVLSSKLGEINTYYHANMSRARKKALKEKILHDINERLETLNKKLPELESRARIVLSRLAV